MENDRYGVGLGGASIDGRTNDLHVLDSGTMTLQRYHGSIMLDPIVRPFAGAVGEEFILMHDDACPRTALICTAYLGQQGTEVVDWPSRSRPRP